MRTKDIYCDYSLVSSLSSRTDGSLSIYTLLAFLIIKRQHGIVEKALEFYLSHLISLNLSSFFCKMSRVDLNDLEVPSSYKNYAILSFGESKIEQR